MSNIKTELGERKTILCDNKFAFWTILELKFFFLMKIA